MSPLALASGTTGPSALRRETMREEYLAFLSLARMQRRLAGVARQRAREAEAEQDLDAYRHFKADAKRLFREAAWHLGMARDRKAKVYG